MQPAAFKEEIVALYDSLVARIAEFNHWWPHHLLAGELWQLPAHQKGEVFVPGGCHAPVAYQNAAAIPEVQAAIAQLHLCGTTHDPTTVMRAPGWVALATPVAERIQPINLLRQRIAERVDAEIADMNLAASTAGNMRGKLLRNAIPGISPRHLLRKLQAFDTPPLSIQFHWAGAGASYTRVSAKTERERLQAHLLNHAAAKGKASDTTGYHRALDLLASLPEDAPLVVARPLTPHPRVMLFFQSRSRYDATPHANLPVFFHCPAGAELPHVRPLPPFERRTDRRGQRSRTQLQLISDYNPKRLIYLDQPERKASRQRRMTTAVTSTYGEDAIGAADQTNQ